MDRIAPRITTDLASERTGLAITRTMLAADRTLMSWIRTGLSVLSFGFAIYKFFMYLKESAVQTALKMHGPRNLGIALISLGTLCMILGLIEYYLLMKRLGSKPWSFVFVTGLISTLLGLFLLSTILLHLEFF